MPQVLTYMKGGAKVTEADPSAGVSRNFRPADTPAGALGPAYETDFQLPNGQTSKSLLLPFANPGRWYGSDAERRRLTPKPEAPGDSATQSDSADAGYRQGAKLQEKTHPHAVWVKPA